MNYKEIEEMAETPEGINKLLEMYMNDFAMVESIGKKMKNGMVLDVSELDNTAGILSGLQITLTPIADILDSVKTGTEGKLNFQKVCELEKSGGKIVQASIDKLVSNEVQHIRRARNIFQTYATQAANGVMSCLSRLKRDKSTGQV